MWLNLFESFFKSFNITLFLLLLLIIYLNPFHRVNLSKKISLFFLFLNYSIYEFACFNEMFYNYSLFFIRLIKFYIPSTNNERLLFTGIYIMLVYNNFWWIIQKFPTIYNLLYTIDLYVFIQNYYFFYLFISFLKINCIVIKFFYLFHKGFFQIEKGIKLQFKQLLLILFFFNLFTMYNYGIYCAILLMIFFSLIFGTVVLKRFEYLKNKNKKVFLASERKDFIYDTKKITEIELIKLNKLFEKQIEDAQKQIEKVDQSEESILKNQMLVNKRL